MRALYLVRKQTCSRGNEISVPKAGFPLGEFVRANKQKGNVIGW